MNHCTCKIGKAPCNYAFIYKDGKLVGEILISMVGNLKSEYTFLCAGAGLQKLNRELKEGMQ